MAEIDRDGVLRAMTGRWRDFYEGYTPLKPSGSGWRGPCPIHGGGGPNFAINPETGLWHCHSQCAVGGDVFEFLARRDGLDFRAALLFLARWVGTAPPAPRPVAAPHPRRTISEAYGYTDDAGRLLYQVVRYEPKRFSLRRPAGDGTWLPDLDGVRRVLYRLPTVISAVEADRTVFITEGEKDADALERLGLVATTALGGAGRWETDYTEALRGADVVILPDNDQPGRDHARKVARALHGRAKRVRVVELPGLPEKGDVSDWIAAGGTPEGLQALVEAAPDRTPEPETASAPDQAAEAAPSPMVAPPPGRTLLADRVIDLCDVPPPSDALELFGRLMLKAASHLLTGATGAGKTTFCFNLACGLAEGGSLWGVEVKQARVLYVDTESGDEGRALKIARLYRDRPRVRGHLFFLPEPANLPEELPALLAFCREREIELVIFDTMRRSFKIRDENDNAEYYRDVVPILDALKRAGVATLTMAHPAKHGNGTARGAGAQEDAGDVNLSLTMHQGSVTAKDAVVKLSVTKNRLLGLGILPLYLRRVGDDQFERVEAGEAGTGPEEASGKPAECRGLLITTLRGAGEDEVVTHSALRQAATQSGFSKATFDRTLQAMKKAQEMEVKPDGGYALTDPFMEG